MAGYIGHKRAKIKLREIGSSLKRMYNAKRIDGKLYLFQLATYNKKTADNLAVHVRTRGGSARITKDEKLFLVWARY